jgi:hypothetical protein
MRTILYLLAFVAIIYGGFLALDYFGYYVEWKNPLMAAIIGAPIVQSLLQSFKRPEKALLDRKLLKKALHLNKTNTETNG